MGLFIKDCREKAFVATKIQALDGFNFMHQFEQSLKRLQTDRVELLHLNGVDTYEEVSQIGIKGGAYERLVKLKEQRTARFIGFTCPKHGQIAEPFIGTEGL